MKKLHLYLLLILLPCLSLAEVLTIDMNKIKVVSFSEGILPLGDSIVSIRPQDPREDPLIIERVQRDSIIEINTGRFKSNHYILIISSSYQLENFDELLEKVLIYPTSFEIEITTSNRNPEYTLFIP